MSGCCSNGGWGKDYASHLDPRLEEEIERFQSLPEDEQQELLQPVLDSLGEGGP